MSAAEMDCPHCGASMRGEEIPAEHRKHKADHDEQVGRLGRCFCLPWGEATHFARVMGHEVQGVYDGVLFYSCPDCGMAWPRWNDGGRLSLVGLQYVETHNTGAIAAKDGAA